MRDPDGSVEFIGDTVRRTLTKGASKEFLQSKLCASLVREGFLVDFSFFRDDVIHSPRLPIVTYPSEWCDAQLFDAGRFTLYLSERILSEGYELKDASALNILLNSGTPVFCDHLSFVRIKTKQWWAMGQFARHFILPLILAARAGWHAHMPHLLSSDGLPPSQAAKLLGIRRYCALAWPLMNEANSWKAPSLDPLDDIGTIYHPFLYKYCRWCLPQPISKASSNWVRYTSARPQYSIGGYRKKIEIVESWLRRAQPKWVIDLGCNTGEFSFLAAEAGASVISVDADHDSISQLYASIDLASHRRIYPIIADLADMPAGLGWLGQEQQGLVARLTPLGEMVLALAIIHHLIATAGITIEAVADFLRKITSRLLLIEVVAPEDPMAQALMAQRNRTDPFPSSDEQIQAFLPSFRIEARETLGPTRELVLFERLKDRNASK